MQENGILEMSFSSKALHEAVRSGNVVMVKFLLWMKTSTNERDSKSRTALHVVCYTKKKETAEIVKVLLSYGAEVNVQDKNGRTPLHEACQLVNKEVVVLLLRSGAKVGLIDNNGWTPLHDACHKARNSAAISVVNALLANHTGLRPAERNSHSGEVVSVVNSKDRNRETALHIASREKNAEVVGLLIRAGATVGLRNNSGMTALNEACYKNAKGVVSLLIRAGAEVEEQDDTGKTALHWAGLAHAWDVVDVLVDNGGNLNGKEFSSGNTPLHFACRPIMYSVSPTSRGKTIETFLRHGAKVDVRNKYLQTPYEEIGPECGVDVHEGLRILSYMERINIEESFMKHVVKLKTLELLNGFEINWMFGPKSFDEMRNRCCQELEAMKSTYVVKDVSLYKVLSRVNRPYRLSPEELAMIDKFLSSPNLLNRFPLYGGSLKTTFQRSQLLTLAVHSFYTPGRKHLVKRLPSEVVEPLLTYLNNNDLRNFLKSE